MVKWRPRDTRDNLFKMVECKTPIVVYDLETTGLKSDKDKIIQISGIKIVHNGTTFEEVARFDTYVNPQIPIPPKITEITGINDTMVFDKPTIKELFPQIKEFFGDSYAVSGYNVAKFDNNFMKHMFENAGEVFSPVCTVDVLEMARDTIDNKETENFKLGTIASLFGVDDGLTFHNSMDDVIATKRLLTVFHKSYLDTYDEDEGLIQNVIVDDGTKRIVSSVHSIRYWDGYRGFARIYIVTNIGEFYYDIRKHIWSVNSKNNPYSVDEIDMESLKIETFKKCGATSEADFITKNTPRKEKTIKEIGSVETMRYWEKTTETGKQYHRIYITTDVGNFYFDIDKRQWLSNGGDVNVSVDMEQLKTLCFEKAGVKNEEEFCAYR